MFESYPLRCACVSWCALTYLTCSCWLKLIWKIPNKLMSVLTLGNIWVRLLKDPAQGPQRGPKDCLDTALAVSTYAQERRPVSAPTPRRCGGVIQDLYC